jgi:tight adherence protein B
MIWEELAVVMAVVVAVVGGVFFAAFLVARRRPQARLARINRHRATDRPGWLRMPAARVRRQVAAWPRVSVAGAGLASAGAGWALGGPVAAVVGGLYAALAAAAWRARAARRRVDRAHLALLDAIDAAASDLRAGLMPEAAPSARFDNARIDDGQIDGGQIDGGQSSGGQSSVPIDAAIAGAVARLEAAYRISEALGTPLADLLDRVDADLRAARRLRLSVGAQTAGVHATSVLLAGLPVVGLGLGASMGVDPLGRLLHTSVGAGCAIAAVLLQCGGLAWTARLVRSATAGIR